jgi:serine/threonine protein kinase
MMSLAGNAPFAEEETTAGGGAGAVEIVPGTLVGEYQVSAKIGEGGMGSVFSAVHPVIGKKVAIKVLNAALSQDKNIVERFVVEAQAVNQIGHRNIVDIFAFGQLPSGRHYFVMEHLSGQSLHERLSAQPPLTYDEAFAIVDEVCDALAAAHAEGIVHRDLKPDNLFLSVSKGGERRIKLLDFGIAKLVGRSNESMQRTDVGTPMGTPLYMSPEQCVGKNVDARSDIYSLGVILFELFSGVLPFPGPSYIETVNGHLSQEPPRPSDYSEIPQELETLILRCLQKDPDLRPQSVLELRHELTQIAENIGSDPKLFRRSLPGNGPGFASEISQSRRIRRQRIRILQAAAGGALLWVTGVLAIKLLPKLATQTEEIIQLQIISDPLGAEIYIDGKSRDAVTPETLALPYQDSFIIGLKKKGFVEVKEKKTIVETSRKNHRAFFTFPLEPEPVKWSAKTSRRAKWTLDDSVVAQDSDQITLEKVKPGHHRLEVQATGYLRFSQDVDVPAQATGPYTVTLTPAVNAPQTIIKRVAAPSAAPTAPPRKAERREQVDENGTSGWPGQK